MDKINIKIHQKHTKTKKKHTKTNTKTNKHKQPPWYTTEFSLFFPTAVMTECYLSISPHWYTAFDIHSRRIHSISRSFICCGFVSWRIAYAHSHRLNHDGIRSFIPPPWSWRDSLFHSTALIMTGFALSFHRRDHDGILFHSKYYAYLKYLLNPWQPNKYNNV